MQSYDVTLVTCKDYYEPKKVTPYIANVLQEDQLVQNALETLGLKVHRTHWDHPSFNWAETRCAVIRATWDYFHRYSEYITWIKEVATQTKLINSPEIIQWNIDKHYLADLERAKVNIVGTKFIEPGDTHPLLFHAEAAGWEEFILKPAISGGGRHTYKTSIADCENLQKVYGELIEQESMILQPYQTQITTRGEVSHMIFGGSYSHSILKMAKPGDFRVQDDFGGSVHTYLPMQPEIDFALKALAACPSQPLYARVDVLWDNDDQLALAELELIEPELWFRDEELAAPMFAEKIKELLSVPAL